MQDDSRPTLVRGVRLHWDEVRKQQMLLYPEGAIALNATAAVILELCDGQRTVDAIVTELESRYQGATVRDDVRHLLERIASRGLMKL
ncbi:MAG: pyrroloquinoline quinone biosynthesis peptide chaperone PqqD [Hydrococcus sp. CSU_1_8]|nr:pyrroloquinoline quinone biosynthesis peptide chaperone PqqD [Hydrococcus sp. CSU_1_8]